GGPEAPAEPPPSPDVGGRAAAGRGGAGPGKSPLVAPGRRADGERGRQEPEEHPRSHLRGVHGKQGLAADGYAFTGCGRPIRARGKAGFVQLCRGRAVNLVMIASKSIRQRWLASSLTALSIALGVALMVAVLVINGVVTRMFNQNATGFQLILGAKGSPMQLVLNTIYFLDRPIENVAYLDYVKVKNLK